MKANPAQANEYNEDTDGANDSDEYQWNDKLVIDEQPGINAPENQLTSRQPQLEDYLDLVISSSAKSKEKRGAKKKMGAKLNPILENQQKNGRQNSSNRQIKAEKVEKTTAIKQGRKRKEREATKRELKNFSSVKEVEPNKSNIEMAGVSSLETGKKWIKEKLDIVTNIDCSTEYDWRSVGCITEPENLGPCESGTHVCLEGIVWQETRNGVLVVNVTWRGKSYMGTLLDATKYDWSPPSCESPISEFDGRNSKSRSKRARVPLSETFKEINERKLRKDMKRQSGATQPLAKAGKTSDSENAEPSSKRACMLFSSRNAGEPSPELIECPEPSCGKKYKNKSGLKYHQKNSHMEKFLNMSDSASDNDKSSLSPSENLKTSLIIKSLENTKMDAALPENISVAKHESENVSGPAIELLKSEISYMADTGTSCLITTSTSTNSTSCVNQSSTVPLAAITPQLIRPLSSIDEREQLKSNPAIISSLNRSPQIPQKLLPKTSTYTRFIAPISTIATQGVYNLSLKPIQPKPTQLPEAIQNPSIHDLCDQKKLILKRCASKDDMGSCYSTLSGGLKSIPQTTELNPNVSVGVMPVHLLSPLTFSDASDEGDEEKKKTESEMRQSHEPLHPFQPFQMAGWPMSPELIKMLMTKDMLQKVESSQPDLGKLTGYLMNRDPGLKGLQQGMCDSPKEYSLNASGLQNTGTDQTNMNGQSQMKVAQARQGSMKANKTPVTSYLRDSPKGLQNTRKPPLFQPGFIPFNFRENFMLGTNLPFPPTEKAEIKDKPTRPQTSPLYPINGEHKILEPESSRISQSPKSSNTPQNPARTTKPDHPSIPPALYSYCPGQ